MKEIFQKTKTAAAEILNLLAALLSIAAFLGTTCHFFEIQSRWKWFAAISSFILFVLSVSLFVANIHAKQKDSQIVALERDGHLHSARMIFLSDYPQDTTRADIGNQNKFHALHSEYTFKISAAKNNGSSNISDISYDFLFAFNAGKCCERGYRQKTERGELVHSIHFVPYFFGDENYFPQNFYYTLGKTTSSEAEKEIENKKTIKHIFQGVEYDFVYEPGVVECVVDDSGSKDGNGKHFLSYKDCDGQNDIYKYPFGEYYLKKNETCHFGFTYDRCGAFYWDKPVELFVIIPRLYFQSTENSAVITVELEDVPENLIVDLTLEEYPMKSGCRTRVFYFNRTITEKCNKSHKECHSIDTSMFEMKRDSIYAVYIHHEFRAPEKKDGIPCALNAEASCGAENLAENVAENNQKESQ